MHAKAILLLLACAATAPAQQTPLTFSVATIRPSHASGWNAFFTSTGYVARGAKLRIIIQDAFGIYQLSRYSGAPSWVDSDIFDIEAKVDEVDLPRFRSLNEEQRQRMLQILLADRFKLVAHHQGKEFPVYQLFVAKTGLKMQETKPDEIPHSDDGKTITDLHTKSDSGLLAGRNFSVRALADSLEQEHDVGRIVVDKTGLTGHYNFTLRWTPENLPVTVPSVGPSIFNALQEQLGLKLEPAKATLDTIVIDHLEHPTEN